MQTMSDIIKVAGRLHNFVIEADGDVDIVTRNDEEGQRINRPHDGRTR
jgi:hypothetical protein